MFTQTSSHHSTAVSNYGALRRATRVLFHVFALVAMLFAFALPQTAAAQWSGSDTSAADPYLITSADDLVLLATNVNAGMDYSGEYFRLENDLDLGVSPYNAGAGWTPIGNDYSKPFKGAFDGNGKTISGLFINRTADYQGLFGYIDGGMVKNLGLENVNIKGSDYVGGVAGVVSGGGSLSNCYATGAVSGYNYVGGVAGRMFSGRISNCAALNPSVKATGSNVGRVVGGSSGTLSGNIAWSGISTGGGTAFSGTTTHDGLNGAPKSADELMASTAFSTFTSPPWTVEDKFLLGLNGSPVEMPLHILAAASASAVQEGNGTEDNPYLIKTPLHLAWLAAKVNAGTDYNGVHFRLENDLDLGVSPYNAGEGWTPIGNDYSKPFKGAFDGNGKTISGLFINRSTSDDQGLFGFVESGEVKNLGLENVNIKGSDYVGGVAGVVSSGGSLSNCYATGAVSGNDSVGGVAGLVYSDGSLSHCYATGAVSGNNAVGGVAGRVFYGGSLGNCYATGAVSGNNAVGGVAGRVFYGGSLGNCHATGAVSGNNSVGGVAGYVSGGGSLSHCYATGAVSGNDIVGGVAGYIEGSIVTNCYATGDVSGTGSTVGGVAGLCDIGGSLTGCAALNPSVKATGFSAGRVVGHVRGSGNISNNIAWDGILNNSGNTTWSGGAANDEDGASKTADELMASGTYPSALTTAPWTYAAKFLPRLNGSLVEMPLHILMAASAVLEGNGTEDNPYLIKTPLHLAWLAAKVNAGTDYNGVHFRLENDLDLGVSPYNAGEGWTPIGNYYSKPFKGTFDGNGKTISGLFINRSADFQGLFGFIESGEVKNLGLENVNITGNEIVGGVAGFVNGSSITNCYATGAVSGTGNYVGGVAGYVCFSGSVTNCYATGAVSGTGNYVGGVAGLVYSDGSLSHCYATGAVSGYSKVGGVAGEVSYGGSLGNCYATGAVSGNNAVGGVAGYVYFSGSVTNCYATGAVSGDNFVGGAVGWIGSSNVTGIHATGAVSGNNIVGGVVGSVNNNSSITGCAALNPSVKATVSDAGRVVGNVFSGTLSGNIAWDGISTNGGSAFPPDDGTNDINGESLTAAQIAGDADGTYGSRFTAANGWTVAVGKLPGLGGAAVDMPAHLIPPGAPAGVTVTAGNAQASVAFTAPPPTAAPPSRATPSPPPPAD